MSNDVASERSGDAADERAGELAGKAILITGAARGIGLSMAQMFAGRGADVILVDKNGEGVEDAGRQIESDGGSALAIRADLAEEDETIAAFERAAERFPGLDVLVINHALHPSGASLLDTPVEEFDRIVSANLRGAFLCTREALKRMVEQGHGSIIGVSSDCVTRSCRNAAVYVASKAGIGTLMRSVAVEFGDRGIRANTITPGVVETPGLIADYSDGRDLDDSLARAAAQSPMGRIGTADEVAETVAFVSSGRASLVNGAELIVDGGMTISYSGD